MARPLHGAILNFKMRITVPTSFRVALVCNFPALGSFYASRVDFETVRTQSYMCGCCRILVL